MTIPSAPLAARGNDTRGATDSGPRGGEATAHGYRRSSTDATASRSDSNHMRRRGAKSFVDDLVLSRGVVLSRAELFCDLLRLSPTTRRFVRFRRTYQRASYYCLSAGAFRTVGTLNIFEEFLPSFLPTHFARWGPRWRQRGRLAPRPLRELRRSHFARLGL